MADKLTQAVLDALSRAAADPSGLPLYAAKADPGLFPATAAAKPAAQKCLADGLLRVARTETRGKAAVECYTLTDAGWDALLAGVNPKQVLEDFVRAIEAREGQVDDLLAVGRRMADGLHGLKDAVARVLKQPNPPTPFPGREGGAGSKPPPFLGEGVGGGVLPSTNGTHAMTAVATRPAPATVASPPTPAEAAAELAAVVVARLADWAAGATAGQDCPLSELYRSLTTRDPAPTVGEFHDALRTLHAAGKVYLHPWTGPLYALPEPTYALLVGHGVAYYASSRQG